ncbi:PREDICTED: zinc finger protein 446 isoform X4 [Chinchilla lanigera]|uniref:zinc finger protein 446 isoform X4 n=1 Tax=Chinchilla lanigera TaxID=34839 RepID=UPI000696C9DF|nr:PREDICTED: zinc finger protein 446 isoform X4 [Chinchilla lanigera]
MRRDPTRVGGPWFLSAAPRRHSRKRMPSPVGPSHLPLGDPEASLEGPEDHSPYSEARGAVCSPEDRGILWEPSALSEGGSLWSSPRGGPTGRQDGRLCPAQLHCEGGARTSQPPTSGPIIQASSGTPGIGLHIFTTTQGSGMVTEECHPFPAMTVAYPQEQWALLDPSQKELCWDAMLQKYGSAVSLGLPDGELNPDRELSPHPTHQDPPVPRKPYTCAQCGCGFDWKSVFVMHRRSHTRAQEPVPSPCASRSTPRHAPGHTCQDCGRSFSWKSQLVIHRKAHAGQRRHACGDCGRAFDWKSQLVIHCKGHRPEAP